MIGNEVNTLVLLIFSAVLQNPPVSGSEKRRVTVHFGRNLQRDAGLLTYDTAGFRPPG